MLVCGRMKENALYFEGCMETGLSSVRRRSLQGNENRTGTLEFMAIEILGQYGRHSYRHDLESFFYVLLWICIRCASVSNPVKPRPTILSGSSGVA